MDNYVIQSFDILPVCDKPSGATLTISCRKSFKYRAVLVNTS